MRLFFSRLALATMSLTVGAPANADCGFSGMPPIDPSLSCLGGSLGVTTPYARSLFFDMPATVRAAIISGTNTADLTGDIQTTIDTVSAAGGGSVFFPAGTFLACGVSVPLNVALVAAPFSATLKAMPNCPQGPLVSKNAWRDIRRLLYSTAAVGASAIVVGDATNVVAGNAILAQDDAGTFRTFRAATVQANTPSIGQTTINFDLSASGYLHAFPVQASTGNAWRNLSDVAQSNIVISGLEIDGNSANQAEYRNVLSTDPADGGSGPPGVGPVTLNGNLVIPGSNVAYFTPNSNLFVRVCTTVAENPGKTITITGKKAMSDYSRVAITQANMSLPPLAGCTQTDIGHMFTQVTGVSVAGGNLAGNLYVGVPDGSQSGNCVTFSAPFFRLQDVQMQHCKGFGFRSDWTAGGGGFNSIYATQQAYVNRVDIENVGQGIAWINGPNDSKFSQIIGAFNINLGFWFDRNSAGSDISQAHFSGANDGIAFRQPAYGVIDDADSITFTDVKSEEAYVSQILLRANNATISEGIYFAPFIAALGEQSTGIQIGDVNYNTTGIKQYRIASRVKQNGGVGIFFAVDGGWGSVNLSGDDFQTSLASAALTGATAVQLNCGACAGSLGRGMSVILALNSGVQNVVLGPYNAGTGLWGVTALNGMASAGNILYRAFSAGGSLYAGVGKSDVRIYMPQGAYPPTFSQAAF